MIERTLRAKHWHIFLLTIGIITIGYVIFFVRMIQNMVAQIAAGGEPNPAIMFEDMSVMITVMSLASFLIYIWFWSIGVGLHSRIAPGGVNGLMRFKVIFLVMVVVNLGTLWYTIGMYDNMKPWMYMDSSDDPVERRGMIANQMTLIMQHSIWVLLMQIIGFGTYIHTLYFCAKTVRTVEKGSVARFGEYIGDFALLMFWPIGVWILQPRINRMVQNEEKDPFLDHLIVE